MNVIILCKSWNVVKVAEIAQALMQHHLTIAAIVAMSRPAAAFSIKHVIQRAHELGFASTWMKLRNRLLPVAQKSNGRYKPVKHTPSPIGHTRENGKKSNESLKMFCQKHCIAYYEVDNLNSETSEAILRKHSPDLIVLGGTPIIRSNILAIPKLGTLNVHMGLLPKFRGRNVAEWSVYLDEPVGITVHLVDPGVDTGAIVYRETVDVSDCPDIEAMRRKLRSIQHQALGKAARLFVDGKLTPIPQTREQGRQYYEMHERLKRVVNEKLKQGYRPPSRRKARLSVAQ